MNFVNCNLGNTFLAKFANNASVHTNVIYFLRDYFLANYRLDLFSFLVGLRND